MNVEHYLNIIKYDKAINKSLINNNLLSTLNITKNDIDQINNKKWSYCRNLTNDFEYVSNKHPNLNKIPYKISRNVYSKLHKNNIGIFNDIYSRAFYKLWEILEKYKIYNLLPQISNEKNIICSITILVL